jgi:hypothetical protein
MNMLDVALTILARVVEIRLRTVCCIQNYIQEVSNESNLADEPAEKVISYELNSNLSSESSSTAVVLFVHNPLGVVVKLNACSEASQLSLDQYL